VELPLSYLLPELILLAAACICTLLGLARKDSLRRAAQTLAALACLAAFITAATGNFGLFTSLDIQRLSNFTLPLNPNYITLLATAAGFLSVLAAWGMPSQDDPAAPDTSARGEFFGMLLFSLAGVAMIGKVNDLIWLFITLELVSIPTYIMVATGRSSIIAQEAGVKYFFLGALAAAIFLFGFSYLYGATGATRFEDIHAYFATPSHVSALAVIGLLLVLIGIAYKIAAFPLHFYAPDVYQGAATPVTAFLAFAPKTAGMVAIISTLNLIGFDYGTTHGRAVLAVLIVMAVVTMTVGNVMALLQRNLKRILAYSSIAHSGYMLVGLIAVKDAVHEGDGISATIFYLTAYVLMNLGAFAVLIYLQGKTDAAEDLDDIAGIAKAHPFAALMFALCLFSLIGMPLTIGFLGKFYIIQQALAAGHTTLAVIVVLNAAIAAAYYLRIVTAMYLREALFPFTVRNVLPIKLSAALCTLAVVALFLFPSVLTSQNQISEKSASLTQSPPTTLPATPASTSPAPLSARN
jgi:NADH-quinone oxidoreductase subunit N